MSFYIDALKTICVQISKETGLAATDVLRIGRSAPYRYKVYQIPKKKRGEFRTIAHPAKELKILQSWVVENILKDLPVHNCATAYKKGGGIKTNAERHSNNNFILKLDFKDFFPSLVPKDFKRHMRAKKPDLLNEEELDFVARILFWKSERDAQPKMSIGAPSSPILSNTILYDFDSDMARFCTDNEMIYTRYADDITISSKKKNTNHALDHVQAVLAGLRYPKLELNHSKTVFASRAGLRRVTGVVIDNSSGISLGRERKRTISAMMHHFITGRLTPEEVQKLRGLLSFAKDIEPGFIVRLKRKYGEKALEIL